MSVLSSAVLVLCACFSYGDNLTYEYNNMLFCDYVAFSGSESIATRVEAVEGTEACVPCFFASAQGENGLTLLLADCPADGYLLDQMPTPEGDGIVLPRVIARWYQVDVGDKLNVYVFDRVITFTVSAFGEEDGRLCFINARAVGFDYNYTLVRAEGGGAYLSALSSSLSVYGVTVSEPSTLFIHHLRFVDAFFSIMKGFVIGVSAISLVATCNLVAVSYLRRREQLRALKLIGMTRAQTAGMVACEGAILVAIATLTCLLGGGVLCGFLDLSLASYGFRLF